MTRLIRTQLRQVMMATAVMALVSAPAAFADLAVQHDSTVLTETAGNGNGIPEPGDTIAVTENVVSFDDSLMTLTGVTGTLSTSNADATIPSASSPYADLMFGWPTPNTNPYSVKLGSSMECGVNVPLTLSLQADSGSSDISFNLPTGQAGAFSGYSSSDVPRAIPDGDSLGLSSTLTMLGTGRVKDLKVRIGSITHTYDGDLTITLIAPDGRSVKLVSGKGGNGDNFTDTVFSDGAASTIRPTDSAPFTGTYRPAEPLSSLDGEPLAGTWTLKVTDGSPGEFGTLDAWGMDIAPAVCAGQPAPETPPTDTTPTDPPPPPPPPHDCGQHNGGVVPSLSKATDNGKGDKPAKDKPCKN
jgi:subtilisin-like proprotein convertase family protein